jgi:hypothetical protein
LSAECQLPHESLKAYTIEVIGAPGDDCLDYTHDTGVGEVATGRGVLSSHHGSINSCIIFAGYPDLTQAWELVVGLLNHASFIRIVSSQL